MEKSRKEIADTAQKLYSDDCMVKKYLDEYDIDGHKDRILLIDVNCKGSSTGKLVYSLYKKGRAMGRVISVCYGRGPLIKEEDIYKFGLDWETILHAFLARVTGLNGYFSFISTYRLIKYIECFKPDVIHIHELHAYFVNQKKLLEYIRRHNIDVVWTFHCEYMYTGKCGVAYNCKKYKEMCNRCPEVKAYPKSFFFDRTKKMFLDKKAILNKLNFSIVAPSMWLENRVRESFLKEKRITTIWNGIDTETFHPRASEHLRDEIGIESGKKIVLFITSKDKTKGNEWVRKIAHSLLNENVVFLMLGKDNYDEEIEKNMVFVDRISNGKKMAELYSLADIYLLCSKIETFSMTCAEALCCGTPVIGFKCGAPETVFSDSSAVFFEYGDVEGVKNEIIARDCKSGLQPDN